MSGRIVVGVDGSDSSRVALAHAIEEARRRGATVQAVYAWTPLVYWGGLEYGAGPIVSREEVERDAHALLDQMLDGLPDDVTVEAVVVEGPAAAALMELARDADLLVVGSRGRGGFTGLLLGSTSHQVASHAECPVMVVPPGAAHDDGD